MSKVLDFFRLKEPAFNDVPDDKLSQFIGVKHPEFLQDDEFRAQFVAQHIAPLRSHEAMQPWFLEYTPRGRGAEPAAPDAPMAEPLPKTWATPAPIAATVPGADAARQAEEIAQDQERRGLTKDGVPVAQPNGYGMLWDATGGRLDDAAAALAGNPAGHGPLKSAVKGFAWANKTLGKEAAGVAADLAESIAQGKLVTDNTKAAVMGDALPLEEYIKDHAKGMTWLSGKIATGIADTLPMLGASAGLAAAGVPMAIAAGAPMAAREDGSIDVAAGVIGGMIPGVAAQGEAAVAKLIAKLPVAQILLRKLQSDPKPIVQIIQKAGGTTLTSEKARKFFETSGGVAAVNAFLLATDAPEIAKRPAEEWPGAVLESMAANLGPSMLSFTAMASGKPSKAAERIYAEQLEKVRAQREAQAEKQARPEAEALAPAPGDVRPASREAAPVAPVDAPPAPEAVVPPEAQLAALRKQQGNAAAENNGGGTNAPGAADSGAAGADEDGTCDARDRGGGLDGRQTGGGADGGCAADRSERFFRGRTAAGRGGAGESDVGVWIEWGEGSGGVWLGADHGVAPEPCAGNGGAGSGVCTAVEHARLPGGG
jgi:hypothetical protein